MVILFAQVAVGWTNLVSSWCRKRMDAVLAAARCGRAQGPVTLSTPCCSTATVPKRSSKARQPVHAESSKQRHSLVRAESSGERQSILNLHLTSFARSVITFLSPIGGQVSPE